MTFVKDWLLTQRLPDGHWDMGGSVNDRVYFPLSDSCRRGEERTRDCTERIGKPVRML